MPSFVNTVELRSRLTDQLRQQRLIKEDEERRQREKDESERINPLSVLLSIGGAALTAGLAGPLLGSIFGGATATAPAVTSGLGIGAGGIGSLGLGAGATSALAGSALPTALSVGGGGAAGAGIGSLLAPKISAGVPSAFQGPGIIPQGIPFAGEEALLGGIKGAFSGLTPGVKPGQALAGGVGQGLEAAETAMKLRAESRKEQRESEKDQLKKLLDLTQEDRTGRSTESLIKLRESQQKLLEAKLKNPVSKSEKTSIAKSLGRNPNTIESQIADALLMDHAFNLAGAIDELNKTSALPEWPKLANRTFISQYLTEIYKDRVSGLTPFQKTTVSLE